MPVMGGDAAEARVMVALLGPVEIGPAGGVLAGVPQPRLRVLLGLLAVAVGRVVSAEALVDGVWGEDWSPGREKNLHALVYQLRRRLTALEPGAEPGRGYCGSAGAVCSGAWVVAGTRAGGCGGLVHAAGWGGGAAGGGAAGGDRG